MVRPLIESPLSRRGFLAGSALVAGGVALAGCDASKSPSSSSSGGGKTVTLTVMYKNNEMTKDHIADFESKNSGIKVQFVEFDATRLNAMLASGSPPDFVRYPAVGSANANARGLAAPLDSYLAKSSVLKVDDLLPVNDGFRWDGKTIGQGPYYGIVKDWSQDATLWYNKSLFTKAKIAPLSPTDGCAARARNPCSWWCCPP
jgi:multiple sugar transport system substrate-binding protein